MSLCALRSHALTAASAVRMPFICDALMACISVGQGSRLPPHAGATKANPAFLHLRQAASSGSFLPDLSLAPHCGLAGFAPNLPSHLSIWMPATGIMQPKQVTDTPFGGSVLFTVTVWALIIATSAAVHAPFFGLAKHMSGLLCCSVLMVQVRHAADILDKAVWLPWTAAWKAARSLEDTHSVCVGLDPPPRHEDASFLFAGLRRHAKHDCGSCIVRADSHFWSPLQFCSLELIAMNWTIGHGGASAPHV
jgi:hypothetical protein